MGKGARIACIVTPWALTVASLVCLVLLEIAGWNPSTLNQYNFFQANFTNLAIPNADSTLAASLQQARNTVGLGNIYQIHLWNYCSANKSTGALDYCSPKTNQFYFDPIQVWGLNNSQANAATPTSSANNAIQSTINQLKQNSQELETKILGESGRKALDTYRTVSRWMFIAYQASFWTTLATILVSILAIFSRWGSLVTWILSILSTFLTFGAVLTSTILFSVLVGALKGVLDKYKVDLQIGTSALAIGWLAVLFSLAATLFWLFSICCCSGRSNPHHKNNKGGLWNAEPKGQGYGAYDHGGANGARGRGLRVEKTGGTYQRVSSPFLGHESDQVPLNPYPQQHMHDRHYQHVPAPQYSAPGGAYEPYRHG